jgi:hypothetical protein
MAGMHSWLGIVTSIVYLLNFLIGLLTAIFRKLKTFEFRLVHQLVGTYAFLLTVCTTISGITFYQGKEKVYELNLFRFIKMQVEMIMMEMTT